MGITINDRCISCEYAWTSENLECRRHAPVYSTVDGKTHWPVVNLNDFCGEFVKSEDFDE